MGTFTTAAMNESLGHALTENAAKGYRYGHIIDESRDPRRRRQGKDTEERNVLPVRPEAPVLKDHKSSDRAVQEKRSSFDPPSKVAALLRTRQPKPRSGDIVRKAKEPKQRVRDIFTAGEIDTWPSGSGNPTAATERDRNIQSHSSLPQATPAGSNKLRRRRAPLWSVSSERYQELFRRAQSLNPVKDNRAKQSITYNTEKAVLANPRKPIVPRRSLQIVDTVSRLLEDTKGGVEYVKGVGVIRLEVEDRSTEQQPAHHPYKKDRTNSDRTPDPNEERRFTVRHMSTEHMDFDDVEIRWTARTNAFDWYKEQQTLKELQAIPAQSIDAISYSLEGQYFDLSLRAINAPGLQRPFNQLLLVMPASPLDFMMLISLFEASIGAMKVNMADQ